MKALNLCSTVVALALVLPCACTDEGGALPDSSTNAARDTSPGALARETTPAIAADKIRLRAHFDAVIAELTSADTGHLTADQRRARAGHIAELRRYRDRAIFPHNHDFPDAPTPYFVDEHGTRCALGHLIEESGGAALVQRIASTRNNAFVAELASDKELIAWLDRAGLNAAEAARIQPTYCDGSPGPCPPDNEIDGAYGIASLVTDAANIISVGINMTPSGRARGWFGVTGGIIGMGLGMTTLDAEGELRALGMFNLGLGTLSLALGIYGVMNSPRPARTVLTTPLGDVSVQPMVTAGAIGLRGEF